MASPGTDYGSHFTEYPDDESAQSHSTGALTNTEVADPTLVKSPVH